METFKKRQKEMKRLEKQREKAARRTQRKQDRINGVGEPASDTPDLPESDSAENESDAVPESSPEVAAKVDQ